MRIMIYTTYAATHHNYGEERKPLKEAVFDEERKRYFIEVNTIEELFAIAKGTGCELVVGDKYPYDDNIPDDVDDPYIEIYNDYRE